MAQLTTAARENRQGQGAAWNLCQVLREGSLHDVRGDRVVASAPETNLRLLRYS